MAQLTRLVWIGAVFAAAAVLAGVGTTASEPRVTPVKPTLGQPPTGLIELPSPFPAREYLLGPIGWQELTDGGRLTVYAGALGSDRSHCVRDWPRSH